MTKKQLEGRTLSVLVADCLAELLARGGSLSVSNTGGPERPVGVTLFLHYLPESACRVFFGGGTTVAGALEDVFSKDIPGLTTDEPGAEAGC